MTTVFRTLLAAVLVLHVAVPAASATPSRDSSTQAPTGSLRESARREGARLAATAYRRSAAQIPTHDRNWAARHPVVLGTLAGAGVGLSFVAANGCSSSSDYSCGGLLMFFGGTGAGLGALGGLAASLFLR